MPSPSIGPRSSGFRARKRPGRGRDGPGRRDGSANTRSRPGSPCSPRAPGRRRPRPWPAWTRARADQAFEGCPPPRKAGEARRHDGPDPADGPQRPVRPALGGALADRHHRHGLVVRQSPGRWRLWPTSTTCSRSSTRCWPGRWRGRTSRPSSPACVPWWPVRVWCAGPGEGRAGGGGAATTKLSREHAVSRPAPGLVVVSGGKYTTYRVMAADAVDAAVAERTVPGPRVGDHGHRTPARSGWFRAALGRPCTALPEDHRITARAGGAPSPALWRPGPRGHRAGRPPAPGWPSPSRERATTLRPRSSTRSPTRARFISKTSLPAAPGYRWRPAHGGVASADGGGRDNGAPPGLGRRPRWRPRWRITARQAQLVDRVGRHGPGRRRRRPPGGSGPDASPAPLGRSDPVMH